MGTSQNSGLWTMSKGKFEESVKVLEAAIAQRGGNPCQIFDRIRTDRIFTDRLAEFALRGGLEVPTYQELARVIPGRNIFRPEEWEALYGVRFTNKQLREITEFPWSEDVLNAPCPFNKGKRVAETHFAFLGLDKLNGKPLTILRWHELHPATAQPRFYSEADPWYRTERFASEVTCEFRWYLMPFEIVPNPERKSYREQVAMLPYEYEVSTAIAEVTKYILTFRKGGIYPNSNSWGQCRDVLSFGGRGYVRVGGYRDAVTVSGWWNVARDGLVGLAVSRKS